jgi:hypothetical protein
MQVFRKLVAIYLGVVGVGTGAQFVLQGFYDSVDAAADGWKVVSWFMAVALVLMLATVIHESRAAGHEAGAPVTRAWLTAKAALYATVFFALLFFWNWFTWEWGRGDAQADPQYWRLIDAGVAVLAVSTSLRAWRAGPSES